MSRDEQAASLLIASRSAGAVLPEGLPDDLRPRSLDEAIAVQLATIRALGPIGGWKVGADSPTAMPSTSPLVASGIVQSPAVLPVRTHEVEAEISFRFAHALLSRDRPYEADEVLAAIGSCQASIEIIAARYRDRTRVDPLSALADLGFHGGLIVGPPVASWDNAMFATLPVEIWVDGAVRRSAVGSNPGGTDLMRLMTWLANADIVRATGGLQAGAVVTTGSWTGAETAHDTASARFQGFPPVEVRFSG